MCASKECPRVSEQDPVRSSPDRSAPLRFSYPCLMLLLVNHHTTMLKICGGIASWRPGRLLLHQFNPAYGNRVDALYFFLSYQYVYSPTQICHARGSLHMGPLITPEGWHASRKEIAEMYCQKKSCDRPGSETHLCAHCMPEAASTKWETSKVSSTVCSHI